MKANWTLRGTLTVGVTKELAAEFSAMDPAPGERGLTERRLGFHKQNIADGRLRPPTWAKAYCSATKKWYRINGNHTSHVLVEMENMPDVTVYVENYLCPALNDVADLWSTYDSAYSNRTLGDIYHAFSGANENLAEIPNGIVKTCISAINLCKLGINKSAGKSLEVSAQARAEYLLDPVNENFIVWINATLQQNKKNHKLHRNAVVAAMYDTWLKDAADAEIFWIAVRDQTGSLSEPPCRLAHFLLNTAPARSASAKFKKTADDPEMYVKCIRAWNAYRKGSSTELRYYMDKSIPKVQ